MQIKESDQEPKDAEKSYERERSKHVFVIKGMYHRTK